MSKAALGRERWKYERVRALLRANGVVHKFEYPLLTKSGKIRLYDLALRDSRQLVEFDGDYHHRNGKAYARRDKAKELTAKRCGWTVVRVVVKANAVIPAKAISHLI
jgi:very-short-patch-repair endonuclease